MKKLSDDYEAELLVLLIRAAGEIVCKEMNFWDCFQDAFPDYKKRLSEAVTKMNVIEIYATQQLLEQHSRNIAALAKDIEAVLPE